MNINVFDILFVIIVVMFTALSFLRGAMKELLGLLGLIGGYLAATWYAGALAGRLQTMLPEVAGIELLSFVLIMMGGYFVGIFLAGFSDMFRESHHTDLSSLLGGLIGFGKGVVISLAFYTVVQTYMPAFQDEMRDSLVGKWLGSLLGTLEQFNLI